MEKTATAKDVRDFFGMDVKTFMAEWKQLSDDDKQWYKTELAKVL